jgi:CheY-like chemotaxis protein
MFHKKTILVVDDDELLLTVTRELLQDEHTDVVTHRNAAGVTNRVSLLRPDLILLDINMPSLSGETVSLLLKSDEGTRDIPIVFYSGNDEDGLRDSAAAYGARGYICKGNIVELRRKVAYYLDVPARKC